MSDQAGIGFDYYAPAELYFPASTGRAGGMNYRRFATVSQALDFVFTTLSGPRLAAATMEVDGQRYDSEGLRRLQAERLRN